MDEWLKPFWPTSHLGHTAGAKSSCRIAAKAPWSCSGTMGDGLTYLKRATEGTGCLPARLQRAIDFMRLIAGRAKFAHSLKPSWQ
jgi:hypothetical protein